MMSAADWQGKDKVMIDKLMKKHGYVLESEDKYGAYYEKIEPQGFTHVVSVIHKQSGNHLMQSYDKQVLYGDGSIGLVNSMCGVEISVLLLLWLKAQYLRVKYHWNKSQKG